MLFFIGRTYQRLNRADDAIDYLEQSQRLAERVGQWDTQVAAINSLGLLHSSLGRFEAAQGYFDKGLAISRQRGDERAEARMLYGQALLADRQQRRDEALRGFNRALEIADRLKLPEREEIRQQRDNVLSRAKE
jgi:tetratricopeptide (TPR) repeat protein